MLSTYIRAGFRGGLRGLQPRGPHKFRAPSML